MAVVANWLEVEAVIASHKKPKAFDVPRTVAGVMPQCVLPATTFRLSPDTLEPVEL